VKKVEYLRRATFNLSN